MTQALGEQLNLNEWAAILSFKSWMVTQYRSS